jgi:prepilin-type N-terminal cleavage/methylation domain-containing protein
MDHRCRAFTLVEVIVVMAIITILMSLLVPTITIVRRMSAKSATQMVMKKVDTCLRLFKTDWQVYPGQMSYPDLSGGAVFTNRLYYHIGTELTATQRQAILDDATAGAANFAYNCTSGSEGAQPSPLTFTYALISNEPRSTWNDGYRRCYASLANRMAREHARLAAVSGNLWLRGPVLTTTPQPAGIVADKRGTLVFPAPRASEGGPGPGWASDYLEGDIEKRYVSGDAILDYWRRPLVYICQSIPGVAGTASMVWQGGTFIRNNKRYGLGPIGFDVSTGPGPALATTRPHLLYGGRVPLSREDAGDGEPTPTDPTYFPDAANFRHSDVRYYAAPGFAREFELWSCGPDRTFDYMRDAAVNTDNLPAAAYEKGL